MRPRRCLLQKAARHQQGATPSPWVGKPRTTAPEDKICVILRAGGLSTVAKMTYFLSFAGLLSRATALTLLVALFCTAAMAEEPPASDRASDLYEQGTRAHQAGEYAKAARLFAQADEILPDAAALQAALSAGLLAGDPVLAISLAARADRNPYDQDMSAAAAAVRSKYSHLVGRVAVRCKACRVRIDGKSSPANQPRWVLTGKHEIVIEVAGRSQRRSVQVEAGASVDVVPLMVEPDKPQTPPITQPAGPDGAGISPAWFWVGVGASALLGGATILSAVDTATLHGEFEEQPTQSSASAGQDAEIRTNVLIGGAAGVAAVTATLAFFVNWSGNPPPVSGALLPGGGLLSASGTF